MTRRKDAPDQPGTLMDANLTLTGERRRIGRVERRVYKAIQVARTRGAIDDLEDPLAAAALAIAQAMDRATSTKPDPYAVAALSREFVKVMQALAFASGPAGGSASNPELDAFLAAMAEPDPGQ